MNKNKKSYGLLDIANELFKDSRTLTMEESKAIADYLRKKSKTIMSKKIIEDERIDKETTGS